MKMEFALQKFYKFYELIGTYPYNIRLLPDSLDYEILLEHGRIRYRWKLLTICSFIHMLKVGIGFFLSLRFYVESNDYLRLMFHCLWSISFVIILSMHFAFIFCKVEVMQLANDTVVCMQKFEKGASLQHCSKVW